MVDEILRSRGKSTNFVELLLGGSAECESVVDLRLLELCSI